MLRGVHVTQHNARLRTSGGKLFISSLRQLPYCSTRVRHLLPCFAAAAADSSSEPHGAIGKSAEIAKGEELLAKNKMLQPSPVNSNMVRALAMLGAVALTAASTQFTPGRLTSFLHLASYGTWLGTLIFNTFIVGLTMFKNMPRQMFGKVQSHLFPQYFLLTTCCNITVLGTLLLSPALSGAAESAALLGGALVCSIVSALYVEPVTTKLMFDRYEIENKTEKTDEDKIKIAALFKSFGIWHGISALLNLVILGGALAHGWSLAGLLVPALPVA